MRIHASLIMRGITGTAINQGELSFQFFTSLTLFCFVTIVTILIMMMIAIDGNNVVIVVVVVHEPFFTEIRQWLLRHCFRIVRHDAIVLPSGPEQM